MTIKPMLIYITGIDGVGKTTHARLIMERLQSRGVHCQYRWQRFQYITSLPLLAFCRLAGYTRVSKLRENKCSYHEFYRSRLISSIFPWTLFVDTALATFVNIYIPMFLGTTIVCDRFVYDTLIDLAIATKDPGIRNRLVGRLFVKLIPGNTKLILLNLDRPLIFSRRPELADDATFNERHELYNSYKDLFGTNGIDNSSSVQQVNNIILASVGI